jgi:hypothetical protein
MEVPGGLQRVVARAAERVPRFLSAGEGVASGSAAELERVQEPHAVHGVVAGATAGLSIGVRVQEDVVVARAADRERGHQPILADIPEGAGDAEGPSAEVVVPGTAMEDPAAQRGVGAVVSPERERVGVPPRVGVEPASDDRGIVARVAVDQVGARPDAAPRFAERIVPRTTGLGIRVAAAVDRVVPVAADDRSLPPLPQMVSSPSRRWIVSSPPLPTITSRPGVPVSVSGGRPCRRSWRVGPCRTPPRPMRHAASVRARRRARRRGRVTHAC